MNFRIIDIQRDQNLNCYSVLTVVSINDFMEFIWSIHDQKGNIEEQRNVLSTRSAKIIRNQMVEDLMGGGVLPPIVLGSIYNSPIDDSNFANIITTKKENGEISIFILDGMQRIQALKDATNQKEINHNLRVEFWFASDESALLYRMLVLNSGQIPWSLQKQLEVVFKPVLNNLKYKVKYSENLYKDAEILELFLAFISRRVRIDKRQQLAEYQSALDIMSLIRDRSGESINKFQEILRKMIEIDLLLKDIEDRYVFDNQTARIGFIVACSEKIFGLLGNEEKKDHFELERNFNDAIEKLNEIKNQIQYNDTKENKRFLDLELLKETLHSIPREKHRQAFLDGFKVIFFDSKIHSLAVCWKRMY